jgi:dTDP-4-dehydrorhamnose 3,5-epimerase
MSLSIDRFEIDGVLLIRPKRFADPRGYFSETYNSKLFGEAGITCVFVQDNQSLSVQKGTIRGLHFQTPPEMQAKLVRVLRGSILDVAVDLRRKSPTYGRWCSTTLTSQGGEQLFLPRGFAHGFCTLEENTEVAYKVDGFYATACDAGLRWDDPDLAITWPVTKAEILVSEKDSKLPFFKTFDSPFDF